MTARRQDMLGAGIVAASTLASIVFFLIVHRPFNLLTYPFKFPDSWSWLVEGLAYQGHDVIPTILAPLTPITFAVLFKFGWADAICHRAMLCHHLLAPVVFVFVRLGLRCTWTATVAALLTLTSASLLGNGLYIGSDVSANCLFWAAVACFWLGVSRRAGWFYAMGLCLGLSCLTQYAAFFLPFPLFTFVLLYHRPLLKNRHYWAGFILSGVLGGSQFLGRWIIYGRPLYSHAQHVELVHVHWDSIGPYAWWSLGFFSIPVILMSLLGFWDGLCRNEFRPFAVLISLVTATMIVFFVILYAWPDNRLIQYWAPGTLIFAAMGLRRCRADLRAARGSPVRSATAVLLTGVVLIYGSLARSQPFSGEVVIAPGIALAIDPLGAGVSPDTPLVVSKLRSHTNFQAFYWSHARAIRGFLAGKRTLPCTFNDATADLVELTPTILKNLSANSVIGLSDSESHASNWHRNTLAFLTRRTVMLASPVDALGVPATDRPMDILVSSDSLAETVSLIPMPSRAAVITLQPGQTATQHLTLPGGIAELRLMTGNFERTDAMIQARLIDSGSNRVLFDERAAVRNNAETILPARVSAAGEYDLVVQCAGAVPAAIYVSSATPPNGWHLTSDALETADRQMVINAGVLNEQWDRSFELVARSGRYHVWRHRSKPTLTSGAN